MNWFNEIESRYPVDKWKVNGVHIWPLIRVRIGFWLRKQSFLLQVSPKALKKPKVKLAKKIYLGVTSMLWLILYYIRTPKKRYLFIGAFSHRESINQIYFNKFFDPIIENIVCPDRHVAVWEYDAYFKEKKYQHRQYIIPLENLVIPFTYLLSLIKVTTPQRRTSILPEFDTFVQEIKQHPSFKDFDEAFEDIFNNTDIIKYFSVFYEVLLRKLKPKLVLMLCYYSFDMYPIIFACKKLGIPCADFQHGPQGELHFAYSRWRNIPEGGFNILPKYFLTWNETSAESFNERVQHNQFHQGVCFGHPWVDYWRNRKEEATYKQRKRRILFSLQPIGDLLTEDEIAMIRTTQERYQWLIRLHPRQLFQQQAVEVLIQKNGLKVVLNEATFQPLPSILAQVDIHCTRSSGTTIEAAMYEVPTLLLDPIGVSYYPEEVANGIAYQPNTFDKEGFINGLEVLEQKKRKAHQQKVSYSCKYQEILDSLS